MPIKQAIIRCLGFKGLIRDDIIHGIVEGVGMMLAMIGYFVAAVKLAIFIRRKTVSRGKIERALYSVARREVLNVVENQGTYPSRR